MVEAGIDPSSLDIAIKLPSNEAVCAAVEISACLTVVSDLVARGRIEARRLAQLPFELPPRRFVSLHHKERYRSKAALALEAIIRERIPRSS